MYTYRFYGGIADGAESPIPVAKWGTNPPNHMWVTVDPQHRKPFGLIANMEGEGTPYVLVGIDADNVAVYHVFSTPHENQSVVERVADDYRDSSSDWY